MDNAHGLRRVVHVLEPMELPPGSGRWTPRVEKWFAPALACATLQEIGTLYD